ncbi:H+/oligopeptide symporter [Handroanthus impetiginosus]|uniref:H+/oligopeptide symporter n=1 Tax=Handroanthus impetiginosus TaxID=429701 RepID=A0A2G9I9D0_9LAMI|nr:H+/oligopeptide symporter [Handroanthus impetiginosus]
MQKMVPLWMKKNMYDKVIVLNAYVKNWIKENDIFNKAVPFISGLIGVHAWVEFTVIAILITHLTDNNWLHLPKAASIVNVQEGLTASLVIVVAYASDAYMGPFKVVVCTTFAYIMGLLLLFLVAWRLVSIEIHLIYVGILLIALGRAGRDIVLKEFLADQFGENETQAERRRKVWWRLASVVGIFVSIIRPTSASWVELCKRSTIIMGSAFAFFLVGIAFYECKKPTKTTPDMTVLRVLYAAISNRHLKYTPAAYDHILDIPVLRWLDKAAIKVESPPTSLEVQERKGRYCTVEEVQEVKILLTMIPLWTTFLVYGVLKAAGNTFFYEQAGYMDNHLGSISHVPVSIFVLIMATSSFIVSRICDFLFPFYWGNKIPRQVMLTRIGAGVAISPICCIIAWRVEHYRLRQDVEFDTPISFFWLLPQVVLLGVMEGIVVDGLQEFFDTHVPESFKKYGPSLTQFALNIGNFLSLAFILIFHDLFNDDLNKSRLGTYYVRLGLICFVNLVFYLCVAMYYVKEQYPQQETELQQLEEQLPEHQVSFQDNTNVTETAP